MHALVVPDTAARLNAQRPPPKFACGPAARALVVRGYLCSVKLPSILHPVDMGLGRGEGV